MCVLGGHGAVEFSTGLRYAQSLGINVNRSLQFQTTTCTPIDSSDFYMVTVRMDKITLLYFYDYDAGDTTWTMSIRHSLLAHYCGNYHFENHYLQRQVVYL